MLESFGSSHPRVDPAAFVHETAVLIGTVEVGSESSIWPNTTLRADDGPIIIGSQTSIQDGTRATPSVVARSGGRATGGSTLSRRLPGR